MSCEFLDHTGDTAVRITAPDAASLFREAVRATLAIYVGPEALESVGSRDEISVRLEAEDGEALLVDFLNELIFLFDTRRFLAASARVEDIDLGSPARLRTVLLGETMDPVRHDLRTEIKAATFHGLTIRVIDAGLSVDVVFDL